MSAELHAPGLSFAAQTIVAPPHGNSLSACFASILRLPVADVPNFVEAPDYWAAMQSAARAHGFGLLKLPLQSGQLPFAAAPGTPCITRGPSPRAGSAGHVVCACVASDGVRLDMQHDPHPSGDGLGGPAAWAAFLVPTEPALLPAPPSAAKPAASELAATHVDTLMSRLAPALRGAGFDLVKPLLAGWYNEEEHIAPLGAEHKLPAPSHTLAVLVGNSRALWTPFCRWVGQRLAADPAWLDANPDALDVYTQEVITSATRECAAALGVPPDAAPPQIVYAYETLETHGRAVSVTTAAHVAGLAYYDLKRQRSVHPILGPWIAYRAIILFEGWEGSVAACGAAKTMAPPPTPRDPCNAAEWAAVEALQTECFAQWETADERTSWDRLVDIVRAFETGRAHAYCDAQIAFHYEPSDARRVAHLKACAEAQTALEEKMDEKAPAMALSTRRALVAVALALGATVLATRRR